MAVLEVDSLCKRFGKHQAILDVSFSVDEGQVFGLLGPNGSGKTTSIACALGLLRPDSGSSMVLGHPARQIARTRGQLGAVFDQDNLIDGLSVRGNLEYARRLLGHKGGRSSSEVLKLAGIAELGSRRAGKLSLGQKKRVAVARALLGSPKLLVLDEPLSALDPMGVKATLHLIRELAGEGISVVLSSHRLHELQAVISHAIVLSGGRCVAQGSLQDLIGEDGLRYRLHLFGVSNQQTVMDWIAKRFAGLQSQVLPTQLEGQTQFEIRGASGREFSAELCAGLCEQGFKIAALQPVMHSLESFFENLVEEQA